VNLTKVRCKQYIEMSMNPFVQLTYANKKIF
jgi:hypothetical protein